MCFKEAISQRENFSLLCKSGCESSGYLKNHLHSCLTFNGSFTITLGLLVTLLFSLSCTSLSSALAYPHPPSSSPLSYNSPFLSFCLLFSTQSFCLQQGTVYTGSTAVCTYFSHGLPWWLRSKQSAC